MSSTEYSPTQESSADRSWLQHDAYVFDIDGTLLNSRDLVHYNAFQTVLRDVYQCDRDISEVPLQGNTDIGILRATTRLSGIDDDTFAAGLQAALSGMVESVAANQNGFRPEVCPSIPKLLAALKRNKKLIGVASGNLEAVAWPKLKAAGIRDYFEFGSFSDHYEERRDIFAVAVSRAKTILGESARVCFVGDTPNDIAAAKANHRPIIAVATGIHSFDELKALSPDFCLRCCDELFT